MQCLSHLVPSKVIWTSSTKYPLICWPCPCDAFLTGYWGALLIMCLSVSPPFFSLQPKSLLWQLKSKFCQLGAFGKKIIRLKKAPENQFTSYHKHPWVFLELIAFLLWTLNLDFASAWICIPLIPRLRRQAMTQNFSMFGYATPMEPLPSEKGLGREQPGVKRNGATQNRIGEHQA